MLKGALRRRDNENHRGKPLRGESDQSRFRSLQPRIGGRREPLLDIRLAYITGPGRRRDTP